MSCEYFFKKRIWGTKGWRTWERVVMLAQQQGWGNSIRTLLFGARFFLSYLSVMRANDDRSETTRMMKRYSFLFRWSVFIFIQLICKASTILKWNDTLIVKSLIVSNSDITGNVIQSVKRKQPCFLSLRSSNLLWCAPGGFHVCLLSEPAPRKLEARKAQK